MDKDEKYELVKSPYEVYMTDPNLTDVPEGMITEVYFQ